MVERLTRGVYAISCILRDCRNHGQYVIDGNGSLDADGYRRKELELSQTTCERRICTVFYAVFGGKAKLDGIAGRVC